MAGAGPDAPARGRPKKWDFIFLITKRRRGRRRRTTRKRATRKRRTEDGNQDLGARDPES